MQNLIDVYVVNAESRARNDMYWVEKEVSRDQCGIAVRDIVGLGSIPKFDTDAQAKLYFRYAVDYLWVGKFLEPVEAWKMVSAKVKKLTKSYPWSGLDGDPDEVVSKLSAPVEKNQRKVTDKERALKWFKENLESFEGLRPKQVQTRMSQELDIHENSCRGLYYFCKKNAK